MITSPDRRLGINGVGEIKAHPFFAGINWEKIRDQPSPYIPKVTSQIDTRNFDKFEEEAPWIDSRAKSSLGKRRDVNFIGYTFKPEDFNLRQQVMSALENLDKIKFAKIKESKTPKQLQRKQISSPLMS